MKTRMSDHTSQSSRHKTSHRNRSGSINDKEKEKRASNFSVSKGRRSSIDGLCQGTNKLSLSCHSERSSHETTTADKRMTVADKRHTHSVTSKKDSSYKEYHSSSHRKSPNATELRPILKQGFSSAENVSSSTTDKKIKSSAQESKFCYRLPVLDQPTIRKTVSFKDEELLPVEYRWPPRRYSSPILRSSSEIDLRSTKPLMS